MENFNDKKPEVRICLCLREANFRLFNIVALNCQLFQRRDPIKITAENYHDLVDLLTGIMVDDIFSPPVASRVYAYSNLSAYEIIAKIIPISAHFP